MEQKRPADIFQELLDYLWNGLDLDVRVPAPQTEDTLDCALLEGELASKLLAALQEQDLPELAAEIAPDWDLPTEAVQSGLETLSSHLELVQGDAALLYEMLYSKADIPEHTRYDTQSLAKFAFSMFWRAMRFAEEQQVPILLDY